MLFLAGARGPVSTDTRGQAAIWTCMRADVQYARRRLRPHGAAAGGCTQRLDATQPPAATWEIALRTADPVLRRR